MEQRETPSRAISASLLGIRSFDWMAAAKAATEAPATGESRQQQRLQRPTATAPVLDSVRHALYRTAGANPRQSPACGMTEMALFLFLAAPSEDPEIGSRVACETPLARSLWYNATSAKSLVQERRSEPFARPEVIARHASGFREIKSILEKQVSVVEASAAEAFCVKRDNAYDTCYFWAIHLPSVRDVLCLLRTHELQS